jgi:hypothetical protein
MTDEELTDAWEAGEVFPGGLSHEQQLRVAWVLHRRHGADEARIRLLVGIEKACEVHGCRERFDYELTERWAAAISERVHRGGLGASAAEFISRNPELRRGDLFSPPRQQG